MEGRKFSAQFFGSAGKFTKVPEILARQSVAKLLLKTSAQ